MQAKVENIFEQFTELFSAFFNQTAHISLTLELSDDEAARGGPRTLEIKRRVRCDACDGRGSPDANPVSACTACHGKGGTTTTQGFFTVQAACAACGSTGRKIENPCTACKGHGVTWAPASLTVNIPAGVQHEQTIEIEGAGHPTAEGVGNLYIYLLVGGRPDSRAAAFDNIAVEPDIPQARIHNAKRPLPLRQIAFIAIVLVILVAITAATRS